MTKQIGHRFLAFLITGILIIGSSFVASYALVPMDQNDLREVTGRDGADISFKLILNQGEAEAAGGTLFFGGGAGSILHRSGNEGHLAIGDISSNMTLSTLHTDIATINSGNSAVTLRMDDGDDLSGMIHMDQIGVTKSSSLASSNVPANLVGDVTLDGTFDLRGQIQAFPN